MTREIKFKVWDNWNKKFLDYGEVDIWDLVFAEPKLMEEIYTDGMANECLEFLQYTGLHDKNGKEIYDGDIVKTDTGIGDICFGGRSCFIIIYKERQNNTKCWSLLGDKRTEQLVEVIGNIYENPELLTNKN